MPKVGMQDLRRRQLIEATVRTIEAHGFADATIARISQRAGLSSGIISHYFGGKNALLEATMRSLLTELQRETIARLRQARTPIARIEAILGASFAEAQFTPQVSSVWLSFYAQVQHSPELARLHRVYVQRLRSNLRDAFGQLLSPETAERAAEGMSSMIDGIWVRAALAQEPPDLRRAHGLADDYLRMALQYYAARERAGYGDHRAGATGTRNGD